MTADLTPDRIMQLGLGFWGSRALLSAIELGLFTELAKGPLDAEQIRGRLGLHPRSVRDFLDALVALGLLDRDGGLYRNTPDADLFLDRAKPTYVGGIMEMAGGRLWTEWGKLTDALRTGRPQSDAAQSGTFEAMYSDPDRMKTFLRAMTGHTLGTAMALAAKFPWSDYRTFIDVGTAQGATAVQVALANRHLTGGGYDLPVVRPAFEEYVAEHGLSDRLGFYAGDFFREPLPTADVLVMGHILHDWDLDQKKHLLARAYEALPRGGALVVHEALIDDDRRRNAFGLLMSLNMLVETPGGFDYTGADCSSWMREAGFRSTRVEHLVGPDSMVVGIK